MLLKASDITARVFTECRFRSFQKIIEHKQRRGNSSETVTIEMTADIVQFRVPKGKHKPSFSEEILGIRKLAD